MFVLFSMPKFKVKLWYMKKSGDTLTLTGPTRPHHTHKHIQFIILSLIESLMSVVFHCVSALHRNISFCIYYVLVLTLFDNNTHTYKQTKKLFVGSSADSEGSKVWLTATESNYINDPL